MDGSEEPTKGKREIGLRPKTYHGTPDGAIGNFRGQTGTEENPTMLEEEAKTVFINSQQENGTICLVISISPSSARSNTGHRRKKNENKQHYEIETTYKTNNIYERTSLSRRSGQHFNTAKSNIAVIEKTTVNKQH